MFKRIPIPFIYVLAAGIFLGLIIGFKTLIPYMYWDKLDDYVWFQSALPHIINYLFWPLLVPFVYWTFEQFKLAKGASFRDRAITILMSLLIPFIHEAVTTVIYFVMLEFLDKYQFDEKAWLLIKAAFPSVYIGRIVEFWIIYGLFAAFDYYKKYKNKQAEVGRMEAQLNRTKLAVLKMQLQPHFLFNALNSISSLMEIDVKKAQTVTAKLGDLLRGILEQDQRVFVTIKEELDYVKTYLEIEKIRFEERLDVEYEIDGRLLDFSIPMLMIQPLVENSIKHGIAKISRPGKIKVEVGEAGDRISIKVTDNGMGQDLSENKMLEKGIGLRNVRARLQELFDGDYRLAIKTSKGEGFSIEIEIPKNNYYENYSNDHRR
ncbi:MAG: histidine kinase [Flavobacteriales bacterium]